MDELLSGDAPAPMPPAVKVGDKVRFQAEMVKGKATVIELKRETAR